MAERVDRMLTEDDPELGWWDHEGEVERAAYNAQDPVLVIQAMAANGRAFAATLAPVRGDAWDRRAERRPGEHVTVRGLARFVLHEVIHHRDDAEAALLAAGGDREEQGSV